MVHKRRATPSLESGGEPTAVVENVERTLLGGAAFTRFGFPARGEARLAGFRGGDGSGSGSHGNGSGSGSNGRGGLSRRQGGGESASSCASSAAKEKKKRRGPAAGSMYSSRSFWFRVLCVAGGSFLLMTTAARRQGFSWPARKRRAAIVTAAVQEDGVEMEVEIEADVQERRLNMAMKHKTFETTPHTLKELLELDSDFSRRRARGGDEDSVDVTAILVASSSLEAQLDALLGGSVQPAQVWVAMPTIGTAAYKAKIAQYQKRSQLDDRLHVVESDLFSDLPAGMAARDWRGVGGSDSGSFFDEKTGLFQLALQAATKFIWVVDPGILPGPKFLHLLAHVSTVKGMTGVFGSEGALMPAAPKKAWRSTHQDKHPAPEAAGGPFALWNTDTDTASRLQPPAGGKATAPGTPDKAKVEVAAATLAGRGAVAVGGTAGPDTGTGVPASVSVLSPVDVLFSQWFLDKDLVRLLFREKWLALGSGNGDPAGLALSYSVRRYAGVPSYVLPSHADLPEYSGDTRTISSSAVPAAAAAPAAAAPAAADLPAGSKKKNNQGARSTTDVAKSSSKGGRREKKPFHSPQNKNKGAGADASSPSSPAAAADPDPDGGGGGGGDRSNPGSRRLASVGDVLGGVVADGEPAEATAAAPAPAQTAGAGSAAASLARRLNDPSLSAQFRELSARAGHFFWTPDRCPKELVLLVVDGRRQAELLEPVYRELVEGYAGGGAEVFVAVVTQGLDESERGGSPLQPFRRTARRDCTQVAEALGVHLNDDDVDSTNGRSRRASLGHAPKWLGGSAQDPDERKSRHFLSPEEFCLGNAFGVFQVRVGQDYHHAPGRPLDPFLEVFHGLSEVLEVARPKIVAYIAAPPRTPNGKAKGDEKANANASKRGRAGMDEMLAMASASYDPEDTLVRAVEAAIRSADGGGADAPSRPIGVGLPPAAAGADAAKALSYLPVGCLELWNKPTITLVLVHARGEDGDLLSRTLRALSEAHYVGDRVELRLALGAGDASDPTINQIVQGLEWEWGDLDVAYYSDAESGGNRLPEGLAALEAFPDPKVHDHIVPLFSGAVPDPQFYVWLKVALINEGYAPWPVKGLPLVSQRLRRSLGFRVGHDSPAGYGGGGGEEEENGGGVSPEDRGTWRRRNSADSGEMWGKFLALSVDIPHGLCPERDGCSRVWMYGSKTWGALRERCRVGLAAEATGGGGGGGGGGVREGTRGTGRRRQEELEPLEVACAVGDVAGRKGSEWGLEARRVCGAGPPDGSGGGGGGYGAGGATWERARVWEVYPVQPGGG